MNINWKTRIKHPTFWIGAISAFIAPVMAYLGMGMQDLTTWGSVAAIFKDMFGNPYMLIVAAMALLSFLGVTTDHTTAGISDSEQALTYTEPKHDN